MKALVYRSTGSWYNIKTETGQAMSARIKGIFKIDDITSTNPLAVGDEVEVEPESEVAGNAVITGIHPRRNYINRQSPAHKMHHHIVAANIDQSLMFATLKDPKTSQGFIDRFLVTCEAYHVPAIVVFNKADLYKKKELEKYNELKAMYHDIGYRTVLVSIKKTRVYRS
jgi:ribosome biogenesis GTPase / thiamine phosphate phosphatase